MITFKKKKLSWLTSILPCGGFNSLYFPFHLCAKWALFYEPVTYMTKSWQIWCSWKFRKRNTRITYLYRLH